MTDEEKRYALALGRRLRLVREARGLTQSQAAALYQEQTGKHGAGLIDLERGRSAVLPLLKLRCLKELYETSYDELLEFGPSDSNELKKDFARQLSQCIGQAHEGRPYSLFFYGERYIRHIYEHENVVEFSVLRPETAGWCRMVWPREVVDRFSGADFERQFSRLIFRLLNQKECPQKIRLVRSEKREGRMICRVIDGSAEVSREEIPVRSAEQLLQYLEGYQRMGYQVELDGFLE